MTRRFDALRKESAAIRARAARLHRGFDTALDSTPAIVRDVKAESLTYLDVAALTDLYRTVQRLDERGLDGDIIEAGCALGGSAIVIATARSRDRAFYIYDVFGTIPTIHSRWR